MRVCVYVCVCVCAGVVCDEVVQYDYIIIIIFVHLVKHGVLTLDSEMWRYRNDLC